MQEIKSHQCKKRALQFNPQTKELNLIQIKKPKIEAENEVLVKVAYSGICGTDLHILQGEFPCKKEPVILGHEFCGTVVDIGKAVKNVAVNDRVVIDPYRGCLGCTNCHSGNSHYCVSGFETFAIGMHKDGGWANYCLVPEEQIFPLPEKITYKQAALCEPLSCVAHGWDRISPLTVGKNILITGAGIIGNLWTIYLHNQGHRNVTVSEPNTHRLKQIEKLETGFHLVTPDELKTMQNSFDVIIDCSGFGPAIEQSATFLKFGGKLCIFGITAPSVKISITPFDIFFKELTIIGARLNPFTFLKALGMIESLSERYLDYDKLGIKLFDLTQYAEALEELKLGNISKAIFVME